MKTFGKNISAIRKNGAEVDRIVINGVKLWDSVCDLSMHDIYGNNRYSRTTANCYIVNREGKYKFPLVYGNAIKDGSVNAAAYTKNDGEYSSEFVNFSNVQITSPYIEEDTGIQATGASLLVADTDNVFADIGISHGTDCAYVEFTVLDVPATGANAVIGVSGTSIMWSWHIWVWNEDMTPVAVEEEIDDTAKEPPYFYMLPYNLGSKWDDDSKTYLRSWYYQWGRPTPQLCTVSSDSSTLSGNYGTATVSTAYVADNIGVVISNPNVFYKTNGGYYNNWFKSSLTYNLWDANCTAAGVTDSDSVKTIYDPSPPGFKVPNCAVFEHIAAKELIGSDDKNDKGLRFKVRKNDTEGFFFPCSGYRMEGGGNVIYEGTIGGYWTSVPYNIYSSYWMRLQEGSPATTENHNFGRSHGFSVRPVME